MNTLNYRYLGWNEPEFLIFFFVMIFFTGSVIGSFLNVCIYRIPRGESVVNAPSHCTTCGKEIKWYDNIPIVSYLVLRGHCRACGAAYSPRYLIVEIVTGLLFAAALAKVALTNEHLAYLGLYCGVIAMLVPAALIDCRHRIIPDKITIPCMFFGVIMSGAFPVLTGALTHWRSALISVISLSAVYLFLRGFAWIGGKLLGEEALGGGDIKFMTAIGACFGLLGAICVLLIGSLIGSAYGLMQVARRHKNGRKKRRVAIAFGPFLAAATLLWMLVGRLVLPYLQWRG